MMMMIDAAFHVETSIGLPFVSGGEGLESPRVAPSL